MTSFNEGNTLKPVRKILSNFQTLIYHHSNRCDHPDLWRIFIECLKWCIDKIGLITLSQQSCAVRLPVVIMWLLSDLLHPDNDYIHCANQFCLNRQGLSNIFLEINDFNFRDIFAGSFDLLSLFIGSVAKIMAVESLYNENVLQLLSSYSIYAALFVLCQSVWVLQFTLCRCVDGNQFLTQDSTRNCVIGAVLCQFVWWMYCRGRTRCVQPGPIGDP